MTDDKTPGTPETPKPASREDRLAERLRENLRKRKEQARARKAAPQPSGEAEDP